MTFLFIMYNKLDNNLSIISVCRLCQIYLPLFFQLKEKFVKQKFNFILSEKHPLTLAVRIAHRYSTARLVMLIEIIFVGCVGCAVLRLDS